jgi:hypothetical protein
MSKTIKIESSIYLDSLMSSYNYNENIDRINENTLIYFDYGNVSKDFPELEIEYGQDEKILKMISEAGLQDDLKDKLEDFDTEDEKSDAIKDFAENDLLDSLYYEHQTCEKLDYLKKNEINSSWSNYDYIRTSGYSQGDEAKTVFNVKHLEECWGAKVDKESLGQLISNLIYDAPMCIRLLVNGEEIYGDKDGYYNNNDDYDKDSIKLDFKNQISEIYPELSTSLVVEALNELIPIEIEHDSVVSSNVYTIALSDTQDDDKPLSSYDVKEPSLSSGNTNKQ